MADILMVYIFMAYIVMVCMIMVYIVMASLVIDTPRTSIVMAYIVMGSPIIDATQVLSSVLARHGYEQYAIDTRSDICLMKKIKHVSRHGM